MYAYFALAALQAVGGFQSADIIRQNGDLQASINEMNAKYADVDAYNALTAGYSNANRYQDVVDATTAADRGAFASEGVAVGYGTAASVQTDNRTAGLLNTLQLQRSARDAAMGYQAQAINMRLGGQMTQLQSGLNANSAESQGIMSAIGTGVTGYQQSNLTGRGRDKDSGTNDKSWQNTSTTMQITPGGNGVATPSKYAGNDSDLGWYSTGEKGDTPGFYGHSDQWRPMSYSGNAYADTLGKYSFTGETGG
jgi:hypothetical protein